MTERDLFFAALDLPAGDRGRFLDDHCGGDADLRSRIEGLLAAHAVSGGFLDSSLDPDATSAAPPDPDATHAYCPPPPAITPPVAVGPGTVVAGRYKLLEQIGEGGMGTVWMAEQTEPVRRKLAVKLVRVDRSSSAAVLARFEAERQAIALMDHPHIARLFDAGTDAGSPFFAMELVKGVAITDFCDQHRLGVRDRLALFGQVCQAVQHAHQKGIIHRDLKPSNILVESHDGRPVPKVIDFGLAKATGGLQLTENTLFTGFGTVLGTPLYMAPEQATFNAVDVDTRADVYALGVVLYELLTGTTPIDRKQLGKAAFEEVLRVIREDDPPSPSHRLSTGEGTPSAAAVRNTEPAQLGRLVKGDLDWVVMKALAKDRDQRYESAVGFARDVERFLNYEPVVAGPPSAWYRVRKFVRRNRVPVLAGVLVFLTLVGGLAGTGWGLVEARRSAAAERTAKDTAERRRQEADDQRQAAEREKRAADEQRRVAEATQEFLQYGLLGQADVTAQADSLLAGGAEVATARSNLTVRELLDRTVAGFTDERLATRFPNQPLVHAGLLQAAGLAYVGVAAYDQALPLLRRAHAIKAAQLGANTRETLVAQQIVVHATKKAGRYGEAADLAAGLVQRMSAALGPADRATLNARNTLANALLEAGRIKEAAAEYNALVPALTALNPTDRITLDARTGLAKAVLAAGQRGRAYTLYREAYEAKAAALGPDHPITVRALCDLAVGTEDAGNPAAALPLYEEARRRTAAAFGPDHPSALIAAGNLAGAYHRRGQTDRALPLAEEVLRRFEAAVGPDHPDTLTSVDNLAGYLGKVGQIDRSVALFERVVAGRSKTLAADHPDLLLSRGNLAIAHGRAGRWDRAAVELEAVLAGRTAKLGADHPSTLSTRANLAYTYLNHGPPERAVAACEEAVRRTTTVLGARSPEALKAREFLVAAYLEVGRPADALVAAEPLAADLAATIGPDHPTTRTIRALLGETLLSVGRFADAEPLLRARLTEREKTTPAAWQTANARSLLGAALMGQKKYVEAEPLLVAGYDGLAKQKPTPTNTKLLRAALDRLIGLYEASGRPDELKKWQDERAKYPIPKEVAPPPREKK